ncbi:hypothetical protein C8Q77DRAFT_1152808 [Trametes polyzona]|nr:hypothetical protein C8Q77DRAFT_1152808 [Trametes polyzona]
MPRYVVDLNNCKCTAIANLQKKGQLSALTWSETSTGAGNSIAWTATCRISGEVAGTSTSNQKGAAKEEAARQALVRLGALSG